MISIVIPTYNRCEILKRTLESLARMEVPPEIEWEVIVVDNSSQDRTKEVIEKFAADYSPLNICYAFEPQPGRSYALNRAIKQARGEIIAMTDDDVTADRQWLSEVKKAFDDSGCTGVAGKVVAVWPCPKPAWLTESGRYRLSKAIVSFDEGEQACVLGVSPLGANLSIKKAAFDRYGLFRTDLGRQRDTLLSGEDTEFFQRISALGERVMYSPKAIVYHPVEKSRIRKSYYRSWCFQDGRGHARTDRLPEGTVRYFGVPRYLFRGAVEAAAKWAISAERKKRFYHELELRRLAGQIVESRRMSRKVGPR